MKKLSLFLFVCFAGFFFSSPCGAAKAAPPRVVHVVVALCDNMYQGIVPVSPKLGNGSDPAGNLYWGAAYGVKTFMRKQPGWTSRDARKSIKDPAILDRMVFANKALNLVMVADAYEGKAIRQATVDFLRYAAREGSFTMEAGDDRIAAGGFADMVVYVGHNGLMDFTLGTTPKGISARPMDAAIFACQSKRYFGEALKRAGARPLIWTRGNMAPEAYSLHALVTEWAKGGKGETVREAVARAYDRYQKCGIRGARGLFATGW